MSAARFYWAVVGNASPEPVAVVEEDGRRVAYTCGCPDPFEVDGPAANITLIHERSSSGQMKRHKRGSSATLDESDKIPPLDVPMKPVDVARQLAANERRLEADRKRGIRHGHRRFNP